MMISQGYLKVVRSFFSYHTKSFADKVSSKLNDQVKGYSYSNFSTKTVPNDDVISGEG